MWLKNNAKYVNVKKCLLQMNAGFLKAIYHLGCMFWMCLAHLWNYLKRCTLKYYDTFIEGCKNGTLWSNSGTAGDKNNCIIIIKGLFCCIWTQMNLTTVLTLSLPLFISLPSKYFITWLKRCSTQQLNSTHQTILKCLFCDPQDENTERWRKIKSVFESTFFWTPQI